MLLYIYFCLPFLLSNLGFSACEPGFYLPVKLISIRRRSVQDKADGFNGTVINSNGTGVVKEAKKNIIFKALLHNTEGNGVQLASYGYCHRFVTKDYDSAYYQPDNPYPDNLEYCLVINRPELLLISFTGVFHIESHATCYFDYIEIYQKYNTHSGFGSLVGRYCGQTAPPPMVLQGPILLHFHTDHSINEEGFRLNWIVVGGNGDNSDENSSNLENDDDNENNKNQTNCEIFTEYGSLSSLKYPNNYPFSYEWCGVFEGEEVYLEFLEFDIELSGYCIWDYLTVNFNGGNAKKYCGTNSPPTGWYNGPVTLTFYSDYIKNKPGYLFRYLINNEPSDSQSGSESHENQGCVTLTGSGRLSSLYYPNDYPANYEWCSVFDEEKVHLEFIDFDIESTGRCKGDYLSITSNGNTIKYCGDNLPPIGWYDGPLELRFSSNAVIERRGFQLIYETAPLTTNPPVNLECNATLHGDGVLESTNYPHNYYNNQNWCFIINGNNIYISFDTFYLESCLNCTCDYLSIIHAEGEDKLCTHPPNRLFKGPIRVYFVTDDKITNHGFRMQYKQVIDNDGDDDSNFNGRNTPCGRAVVPIPRIVGGTESQPGQWPWQVVLYVPGSRCGGVIVGRRWILTAAHCVVDINNNQHPTTNVSIVVGEHQRSTFEGNERIIFAEEIYAHESYTGSVIDLFSNDIALIKLKEYINYNDYVQPICLKRIGVAAPENCVTSGWGTTVNSGTVNPFDSDRLHHVGLTTVDRVTCRSIYGPSISTKHLCAHNIAKGICHGDSGGPIVCLSDSKYYLQGVVSFSNAVCGSHPSVFTRLSSYVRWIQMNTSGEVYIKY